MQRGWDHSEVRQKLRLEPLGFAAHLVQTLAGERGPRADAAPTTLRRRLEASALMQVTPVTLPHQGKGPASTQALVDGDKWVSISLPGQPFAST